MKIRKKITLWISGTALLSTIAFSSIIFWELMEEPFKLIDQEIQHMAAALALQMAAAKTVSGPYDLSGMPYNPDTYWIMVKNNKGKILYQSRLTRYTDLSIIKDKPAYLIGKKILRSQIWLNQDDHNDVLFRVMVINEQINGRGVEIRIAKPIEGLEKELIELAVDIGISLFISLIKQLETTRRMSHLVKNLLDLSRLEQQETLKQGTIDLTVLLARVLDDYADVLAAKQVSVFNHLAGPHSIHGDQEKLFRLFVNLIDNAIRYNIDCGGKIPLPLPWRIRVRLGHC